MRLRDGRCDSNSRCELDRLGASRHGWDPWGKADQTSKKEKTGRARGKRMEMGREEGNVPKRP